MKLRIEEDNTIQPNDRNRLGDQIEMLPRMLKFDRRVRKIGMNLIWAHDNEIIGTNSEPV